MSYLTQLKTFVEVYRSGNITRAATNLNMSQPAVTSHIQTMEAIVGKPLFVRKPRGVEPTPVADDLALQVSSHIDILEQKVASIRSRASTLHGVLHLAGPAEYLSLVAGPQLANLLQADQINLVVHTGSKRQIYQYLEQDVAELAITASVPDVRMYEYQHLDKERLLLVMNRIQGRALAERQITAEVLNQYKVVAYDEQLPLVRTYFNAVFSASCQSPIAAMCPDIRTLSSIVRAGIGYSVLPDYLCKEGIERGELIQLGPTGPQNDIYLVWKKGALRHPRIAFAKDVISAFANLNALSFQR
ncbi:LysR family transcriptional regulator [Alteromonas aestuariivivens]|uniref:LysR family transcriptional regulator n=1 Tax=Alteromonas aestuariivivens TaxID=1938339 RepID=A0A3D8MDU6_9ALTE|nr:LysR family transcriptional regulator [Alteromonas aestuariivivens]RDV28923.1 LysR family transcriptional regulator [Alteromonas aestuariivivens]